MPRYLAFLLAIFSLYGFTNDNDFKKQYHYEPQKHKVKPEQHNKDVAENLNQPLTIEEETRFVEFENDIKKLLGRIEMIEHNQKVIEQKITQLESTLDSQLSSSSKKMTLPQPQKITLAPAANKPELKDDELSSDEQEKRQYDEALSLLKDDKLNKASKQFFDFIQKYPNSARLSNAYFWYGESFYRQDNYEKAALYYLKGYKKFPKGAKSSDSLLKLSLSLGKINKLKEACSTLEKLDKEFPNRSAISTKRSEDAYSKFNCQPKPVKKIKDDR